MGTQLVLNAPGRLRYEEYPEPDLAPGQVRVRALFSGVSAGTELAQYRGTVPEAKRAWDPKRRIFSPPEGSLRYPMRDGYEQVGEITEMATETSGLRRGDVVWGSWRHRSTHVLDAWNRQRLEETVMALQHAGRLQLRDLITHVVPFSRASDAFETLDRRPHEALQVVMKF